MSKLKSMVDYVLNEKLNDTIDKDLYDIHKDYAKFITQHSEKWMFVPCDEDGNVLEEPISDYEPINFWNEGIIDEKHNILYGEYEEAKAKVLFKGNFSVIDRKTYKIVKLDNKTIWISWNKSKTIEDLIPYNLEVTESIAKKYNL